LSTIFQFTSHFAPTCETVRWLVSIFFQKNISGIANVGNLKGFKVAVKKGDANVDYLLGQGINSLEYYDSYEDIVKAASKNEETIFVMDQPPAQYFLYKYGIQDQFRSSEPLVGGEFHRAVRKGNTPVLNLVVNGFSRITSVEYQKINERWFGTRNSQDLTWLLPYLGLTFIIAIALILVLFIFNRILQRRVHKSTLDLQEALERQQKSDARFREAVEFFPVPIGISDKYGAVLSVNKKFVDIFGYTKADSLNIQEWVLRTYEDHQDQQKVAFQWSDDVANATHDGSTTVLREYKVACKDGTLRDVEIVMHPISDLWVAYFNDITERRRVYAALRESEIKYRGVFEFASDALFLLENNIIIDCNPSSLQIFGCLREEFIGQPFLRFLPRSQSDGYNSGDYFGEKLHCAMDGDPQSFEWIQVRLDGEPFNADTSLNRLILDGRVFIQVTVRDITGRKYAEKVQNAIYKISQAAIADDNINELYRSIHTILSELIPVDNFYIALYDPDSDLIHFPYYVDQFDQQPSPAKPGRGLTEFVLRKGRTVFLSHDVFVDLVQKGEVELVGTEPYNWLGSPLKVEERIIGVMVVQNYKEGYQFSQENLSLLEFVSSQVALTIERKRAEEGLRNLSITDELTGIYNRRGFILLAEQQIKQAHRMKRGIYLIFTDMDGLKNINDTYGHSEGDNALIEVAEVLLETFREADILSRFGGDEFVVLALDANADDAGIIISRLEKNLDTHNLKAERPYKLFLSIGVTRYDPDNPRSVTELIAQADRLMYQHKQTKNASSGVNELKA